MACNWIVHSIHWCVDQFVQILSVRTQTERFPAHIFYLNKHQHSPTFPLFGIAPDVFESDVCIFSVSRSSGNSSNRRDSDQDIHCDVEIERTMNFVKIFHCCLWIWRSSAELVLGRMWWWDGFSGIWKHWSTRSHFGWMTKRKSTNLAVNLVEHDDKATDDEKAKLCKLHNRERRIAWHFTPALEFSLMTNLRCDLWVLNGEDCESWNETWLSHF